MGGKACTVSRSHPQNDDAFVFETLAVPYDEGDAPREC
jgi:hypothetical protein